MNGKMNIEGIKLCCLWSGAQLNMLIRFLVLLLHICAHVCSSGTNVLLSVYKRFWQRLQLALRAGQACRLGAGERPAARALQEPPNIPVGMLRCLHWAGQRVAVRTRPQL